VRGEEGKKKESQPLSLVGSRRTAGTSDEQLNQGAIKGKKKRKEKRKKGKGEEKE